MADQGYTPSMERVEDLFAWAVAWDAGKHEDRPDLAWLQVQQRAEFRRALAAHDAVIREDQAKKDAGVVEMMIDDRWGIARQIRGQSFTGTEKE